MGTLHYETAEGTRSVVNVDTARARDDFHSFGELYEHRTTLFLALCSGMRDEPGVRIWASKQHHAEDDAIYPGYFIAGLEMEGASGAVLYHMRLSYWAHAMLAGCQEVACAPKWDGKQGATPARLREMIEMRVMLHAARDQRIWSPPQVDCIKPPAAPAAPAPKPRSKAKAVLLFGTQEIEVEMMLMEEQLAEFARPKASPIIPVARLAEAEATLQEIAREQGARAAQEALQHMGAPILHVAPAAREYYAKQGVPAGAVESKESRAALSRLMQEHILAQGLPAGAYTYILDPADHTLRAVHMATGEVAGIITHEGAVHYPATTAAIDSAYECCRDLIKARGGWVLSGARFRNRKSALMYEVVGVSTDCTNARSDKEVMMVQYQPVGAIDQRTLYTRDLVEFLRKFEMTQASPDVLAILGTK